jgi:hypothetical protein
MRKLLLILFLLPLAVIGQSLNYDTTFADGAGSNWKASVHLPSDYYTTNKLYKLIMFIPGTGEIGGGYAALDTYGPLAYIDGGWGGGVTLGNGTHYPILIALEPRTDYEVSGTRTATVVNAIVNRYKIQSGCVYATGMSAGGFAWKVMVTFDSPDTSPPYGPFTHADKVAAIADIQGVIPDAPNTDWYTRVKNFAHNQYSGQYFGIWDTGDAERGIGRFKDSMNAAVSGSGRIVITSVGHTATAWNNAYGSSGGSAPINYTIDGVSQTVYQWLLRQGDTTFATDGAGSIAANAGTDYAVTYNQEGLARTFTLTGSQTGGTSPTYSWAALSVNPVSTTITSSSSATTTVTGATNPGYYGYELTVTEGAESDKDTVYVQVRDLMQRGLLPCRSGPGVRHYIGGTLITGKVTTTEIYVPYITRDNVFPGLMGGDTIVVLKNPNNDTGYWKWVFMGDFSGQRSCPITVVPDTSGSTVVSSGPGGSRGWYLGNGDSATIAFVKFDGGAWFNRTGIRHGFAADNGQYPYDSSDATVYTLNTGVVLNLGHDVEFTGWRFRNSNYMFQVKKNSDSTNEFATYDNYRFRNIYIHHNYGYMLGSEGMYLGHTAWDGVGQDGNNGRTIMMDSLRVEKNVVVKAGKDGIQIANQKTPAFIHDNTVYQSGYRNASSHRWSIFIGGNATGSIYRNTIINARGAAGTLGMGTVYLYENIIDSVGEGGNTEPAIYVNKSVWTGNFDSLKFRMYGNLITRVLKTGNNSFVQVDNLAGLMGKGKIYNNTFVSATKTLISQMVTTNASDTVENNTIISSLDISTHPLAAMDSYRVYKVLRASAPGTPVSFYDLQIVRQFGGRKQLHKGRKFNFKYK